MPPFALTSTSPPRKVTAKTPAVAPLTAPPLTVTVPPLSVSARIAAPVPLTVPLLVTSIKAAKKVLAMMPSPAVAEIVPGPALMMIPPGPASCTSRPTEDPVMSPVTTQVSTIGGDVSVQAASALFGIENANSTVEASTAPRTVKAPRRCESTIMDQPSRAIADRLPGARSRRRIVGPARSRSPCRRYQPQTPRASCKGRRGPGDCYSRQREW